MGSADPQTLPRRRPSGRAPGAFAAWSLAQQTSAAPSARLDLRGAPGTPPQPHRPAPGPTGAGLVTTQRSLLREGPAPAWQGGGAERPPACSLLVWRWSACRACPGAVGPGHSDPAWRLPGPMFWTRRRSSEEGRELPGSDAQAWAGRGVLIAPPPPPPPPQASTSLFPPRCGLSAQKLGWDPGPPLPAWPVTAHKTSCLWVGPPPQEGQPGGPQGAPPRRADRGGGRGGQCGAVGSHPVAGGGLDHTRLGELGQWLDLRPLSLQRQPLLAWEAWAELTSPSSRPPRSPHGPRPSGDLSLRPPAVRCPF